MKLKVAHPSRIVSGKINLEGSKSISNRVLIIRHLSGSDFEIKNLSTSDDTQALIDILSDIKEINDVHHAGTTFRFLTSVFAFKSGTQILTGSKRMQERPIKPLVDALRSIGADIEYVKEEGFPPLKINAPKLNTNNQVNINAGVSSQFISSLALIGPSLPDGIDIKLEGELVSRPYIQMTLDIMASFGIVYTWDADIIRIPKQDYRPHSFFVESDWSSASYLFAMCALSKECNVQVKGLLEESLQPDSQINNIAKHYGIEAEFKDGALNIRKQESNIAGFIEHDFINHPDIAQTVFVINAGLGISGLYKGLKTLKIKETDRVKAVSTELMKLGVILTKVPNRFATKSSDEMYMQEGKANINENTFETYQDHRMAMAFAPLALISPVFINDSGVVSKSYPSYWKDMEHLGFKVEQV